MRSADRKQVDSDTPVASDSPDYVPTNQCDGDPASGARDGSDVRNHTSRRAIIREGAKLAFVAPLLSTFLASQAYASNVYSCYPTGGPCDGGEGEPCCNGACVANVCP